MEALSLMDNMSGLIPASLIVLVPFSVGVMLLKKPDHGKRILSFVFLSGSILAVLMLAYGKEMRFSLEGSFGVELLLDRFAWTFVLMNCLVFLGVTISMQKGTLPLFAFPLMAMLHGTANAVFISYDLYNVFVCIELASILAFLLIRIGRKPRQAWSAVMYLIVGNVGMILYLLGCLYAYNRSGSFSMSILPDLSGLPVYLLITGLSVKGGIFCMGLWLPEAHGEAESTVSALLSGVIVKIGIAPLLRMSTLSPTILKVVSVLAIFTSLYGVIYAVFEKDLKKMLAYHTISQMGFIMVLPAFGHIYGLAHGLFKSWLFLTAGRLNTRDLKELKGRGLKADLRFPLLIGALAISGMPLLGGYAIKSKIFTGLAYWQVPFMYLAATGTCLSFAKLVFIPLNPGCPVFRMLNRTDMFFVVSLVALDFSSGYFSLFSMIKASLFFMAGWGFYLLFMRKNFMELPKWPEELVHIIGLSLLCILAMMGVFGS